jgi:preprotein translocase subunit YajC
MDNNWPYIFLIVIFSDVFIFFLIKRNRKDKKEVVDQLNNDYKKSKDEENDVDPEEIAK